MRTLIKTRLSPSLTCYALRLFNFVYVHWHAGGTQSDTAIDTSDSDYNFGYPLKPRFRMRGISVRGKNIHLPFIKEYAV